MLSLEPRGKEFMRVLKWKYPNREWMYENNALSTELGTARFILGTKGEKPLICFGINPSTAWHKEPDDTLYRVEKYADKHGYDSWIMFNIYPQRATNPKDLHKNDEFDKALHNKNLEHIDNILSQFPTIQIWAGWGDVINKRAYLKDCLADIKKVVDKHKCEWLSLLDKPCHPLCRIKGFDLYETKLQKIII